MLFPTVLAKPGKAVLAFFFALVELLLFKGYGKPRVFRGLNIRSVQDE